MSKELIEFETDPYFLFVYAFNSQLTKQKSVPRLNKFFEFLGLNGTMQENCSSFARDAKDQPSWALNSIIRYLQMNKKRIENKEIMDYAILTKAQVKGTLGDFIGIKEY